MLTPVYAGGVNSETRANNDLLNTFRTLILTNIHDSNIESLKIQDGIVDVVADGDPFEPAGSINVFTGGTPSADSTFGGFVVSNAFNGNFSANFWASDGSAFPHFLNYDLGSGVTKIIDKIKFGNYYDVNRSQLKNFVFQGSNDNVTYTDLLTDTAAERFVDGVIEEFTFSNTVAYRYYRLKLIDAYRTNDTNGRSHELQGFEVVNGEIPPVISESVPAERVPETCHIVLFEEDDDPVNLNSDLKAFCSRDDGTTWTTVELADEGDYDTDKRILSGTGRFDDDVPTGTSMSYKLEKTNTDLNINGIGFEWD